MLYPITTATRTLTDLSGIWKFADCRIKLDK